jgi:hypothetical protein
MGRGLRGGCGPLPSQIVLEKTEVSLHAIIITITIIIIIIIITEHVPKEVLIKSWTP